ncbi:metallophosphoesterase [Carnobacteriaceae bacterium zg-C25]|nr:metallophosphoesterase [Carnobacteriaceae bacterium zg-C25]
MKKLIYCLLMILLGGCATHRNTEPITKNDAIWVITDLHHLSNTLHDNGTALRQIQATAAGKDLVYGHERMLALIEQAKIEKPKVLIVSGDLTFNGEKKSLEDLSHYFDTIQKNGTQVLVIPGNHDISSGWARSFMGDEQHVVDQILPDTFKNLMKPFGLETAIARDDTSLSYVSQPFSNLRFLMIDSNIYSSSKSTTAPATNGRLKESTLHFIDAQLQKAKNDNVLIIPVMHHNVLAHHDRLTRGYQLDNAADLMALYEKYGVKLSLSGHIHTQSIKKQQMLGNVEHTEIVTEAFSLTPVPIGKITIENNTLTYHYMPLNFEPFLLTYPQTNEDLIHHKAYLSKVFYSSNYQLVHDALYPESIYSIELGDQLTHIVSPLNEFFFSGEAITQEYVDTHVYGNPAYQKLVNHNPNSFLIRYIERSIKARLNHSTQHITIPLN